MSYVEASSILAQLAEDFEEVAEAIREDEDVSETNLGEFFEGLTLDPATLDAVAEVCASLADGVPQADLVNDAVMALSVRTSEVFQSDNLPLIVGSEDEPELINADGSRAENVFSIPEIVELMELLLVPVALSTEAERSYVRGHRLIRGGYHHGTLSHLLERVIATTESAAFEDLVKRIDIDLSDIDLSGTDLEGTQ